MPPLEDAANATAASTFDCRDSHDVLRPILSSLPTGKEYGELCGLIGFDCFALVVNWSVMPSFWLVSRLFSAGVCMIEVFTDTDGTSCVTDVAAIDGGGEIVGGRIGDAERFDMGDAERW